MAARYYRYWGKAKKDADSEGPDYHLLVYHSLDVAAVGSVLLDPKTALCQSLARQLGVDARWLQDWFVFCLRLHDLGKFFRAFQNLVPNLSLQLVPFAGQCTYAERHDTLGFALWQKTLAKALSDVVPAVYSRLIEPWLEIACGHHGQPPKKIAYPITSYLLEEDELAAEEFVRDILTLWPVELSSLDGIGKQNFRRVSWQLAGLAVLADWLGSNQNIFRYRSNVMPLTDYWHQVALPDAQQAVAMAQLGERRIAPFSSIQQQFDFISDDTATPLQHHAQTLPLGAGPQLFILEDVTGAGKTEAAMVLVHRLMASGQAQGVYVGLPTMATANAMYERMRDSYRRLYTDSELPSLVLSHGARELSQAFSESVMLNDQKTDSNYDKGELSASAYCNQWLADNRKKALLADVGVGTIDQVLLGVLPARHQSLRLLGLTGKVLLVDEVHAFDPYMRQLLEALLHAHAAQGGSAILLSATLPFQFRSNLVNAYVVGAGWEPASLANQHDYPLVTQMSSAGLNETRVATRESVKRRVRVERLSDEASTMAVIQQAVSRGQCICWIRNTVRDARQAYQQLAEQPWIEDNKLTLFHSRYAMIDRQRIELDVLSRFGKSSGRTQRQGQVLIATQVVEQSLDLDFDVMISDLAPIDLLIQRAGRLQRHIRNTKGDLLQTETTDQRPIPCLHLLAPDPSHADDRDWLRVLLPGTQAVYPHVGQLWLTLRALLKNAGFAMPEDARTLIEAVYAEGAQDDIPVELQQASDEALAKQHAMQGMGTFNCLKLGKGYTRSSAGHNGGWDEEVRVPTRLGDDTVTVALAKPGAQGLTPYAEHKDRKNAWALSQISLPVQEWEKVSQLIPEGMKQAVSELKDKQAAIRWVEVLPMVDDVLPLYSPRGGWGSPH
jgi:CRISPR-associated endonuclease/helicase Cas3